MFQWHLPISYFLLKILSNKFSISLFSSFSHSSLLLSLYISCLLNVSGGSVLLQSIIFSKLLSLCTFSQEVEKMIILVHHTHHRLTYQKGIPSFGYFLYANLFVPCSCTYTFCLEIAVSCEWCTHSGPIAIKRHKYMRRQQNDLHTGSTWMSIPLLVMCGWDTHGK